MYKANPVSFLVLFLAANGQTALINACEVNRPWMIIVLRFAFLPFSGLKGEQGFIYSRITNSTTMNELSTITFTYVINKRKINTVLYHATK